MNVREKIVTGYLIIALLLTAKTFGEKKLVKIMDQRIAVASSQMTHLFQTLGSLNECVLQVTYTAKEVGLYYALDDVPSATEKKDTLDTIVERYHKESKAIQGYAESHSIERDAGIPDLLQAGATLLEAADRYVKEAEQKVPVTAMKVSENALENAAVVFSSNFKGLLTRERGALYARSDVARTSIRSVEKSFMVFDLAIISISMLLGLTISVSLTRPIHRLKQAAEAIGSGDLDHRIATDWGGEIGDLITAFNTMGQARQQAESQLAKLTQELDQRVIERTTELEASELRFKTLTGVLPIGVFRADLTGKIVYVNDQWRTMFKDTAKDIWQRAIHSDDRESIASEWQRHYDEKIPFCRTLRLVNEPGDMQWVDLQSTEDFDKEGRLIGFVGTAVDITHYKRLQNEILDIGEKEIRRIGQELHDNVGQLLTGIAARVETVDPVLCEHCNVETQVPEAGRLAELVKMAVMQTRMLSSSYYPVDLEEQGLIAALKRLSNNSEKLYDIRCHFECEDSIPKLSLTRELHLYRISQECITNAYKHGKAADVWIQLRNDNGHLTLSIENNGLPYQENKKSGLGIHIMGNRSEAIDADLSIRNNDDDHCEVVCKLRDRLFSS